LTDDSEFAMNIEEIMDSLVSRRAPALPPEALAEVFDYLIWCLENNGAEIEAVRRKWLNGEDVDKIAIALAMTEGFPCASHQEMIGLFGRIMNRWPTFHDACHDILDRWDQQHGRVPADRAECPTV
jgi:hypothetical protein